MKTENRAKTKRKFISLAEARPDLAKEWNYEKNGDLRPEDVSYGSNKKVWWIYHFDVPDDYPVESLRGKHFDFEWVTSIYNCSKSNGCPYLSGHAVWIGFNDLQTVNPELAAQWHPTKNGDLKPTLVTANSNRKVWWLYPYDDPNTGKHFEFEWNASVNDRKNGNGCPYLSGQAVWSGFNDLQTINPELAKQWHPTKNGDLKPTQVTANSLKRVWWLLPYDDTNTGKHFEFEWESPIHNRNKGKSCPYLAGKAVCHGFNDLETVNPKLAKQWHPTKNGDLKPTQVTASSDKKIWWLLSYDDSKTGKHFDFEWQDTVSNRNKGYGCPFITGHAVWTGFNDLATVNPELAAQWHPTKNADLKPTRITIGSAKKVWWFLPYDVPLDCPVKHLSGKHFNFEWRAAIISRNSGLDCPFLSGQAVWKGFNDLQTLNPDLAAQWHPTKNGDLKPTQVTIGTNKSIWWLLSYDVPDNYPIESLRGKHFDFEWKASIVNRNNGNGCPYLSGQAVWSGFNDLQTVNPELARQWHPTKNGGLKPTQVTANSPRRVWWLLSYDDPNTGKHSTFEWQATIYNRNNGAGCPYLTMYKGEEYIKQYLQENNTVYYAQQKFSNLFGINNGKLSYDFSIPDAKYGFILIEYNGLQHYESCEFFGGEEQFKKQQEHDRRKREYAKQHGYKLISIKYTYDTYEKVAEYLDKHLPKENCKKISKKAA